MHVTLVISYNAKRPEIIRPVRKRGRPDTLVDCQCEAQLPLCIVISQERIVGQPDRATDHRLRRRFVNEGSIGACRSRIQHVGNAYFGASCAIPTRIRGGKNILQKRAGALRAHACILSPARLNHYRGNAHNQREHGNCSSSHAG